MNDHPVDRKTYDFARWVLAAALAAGWPAARTPAVQTALADSDHHDQDSSDAGALHEPPGRDAVISMTEAHAHMGPHFRWTARRPADQADQRRAAEILEALRRALAPYRDHRTALRDGYAPFLPNVPQAHYHFTSKWRGLKSAFRFNPEQPTSLLYRRTADGGYELEGAMYTAPKRADEDELNKRVPLSVAQWHAHVNICLPPRSARKTADWTLFGPNGSVATQGECTALQGQWVPQLFGWMIHVYPFNESPDRIWAH